MIIYRQYKEHPTKENTFLDRVWYDSSNIVYSECEDKEGEAKTLRVVFNNGSMYEYKNVDVNDYVMFVHGGIENSNGKAFFKYIKGKYEFERLNDVDKQQLNNEKVMLIEAEQKAKQEQQQEEKENNEEIDNGTTDTENNVE